MLLNNIKQYIYELSEKFRSFFISGNKQKYSPIDLFEHFQKLIAQNNIALEIMSDLGEKLSGEYVFDCRYIEESVIKLADSLYKMIYHLDCMAPKKYVQLFRIYNRIRSEIDMELKGRVCIPDGDLVVPYTKIDDTLEDLVGGKNASLCIVGNVLGFNIPSGFAITTRAFELIVREGIIADKIQDYLEKWQQDKISTEEVSAKLQNIILDAKLPDELVKAILKGIAELKKEVNKQSLRLAVRSSALGEDSEHSFAGQYSSFINVPEAKVLDAYKRVVASTYSRRAMEYRREKGILESEIAMAVGCQVIVPARVSGVVYTLDAFNLEKERVVISALPGIGEKLVAGQRDADRYFVSRTVPHSILGMEIVHKKDMLIATGNQEEGLCQVNVDEEAADRPCLTSSQVLELAKAALQLEKYFKHPQDIEFAFDDQNRLVILQSRPLNLQQSKPGLVCDLTKLAQKFPVIFEQKGEIVQEGVAMGKVCLIKDDKDLENVPEGAILVAHFSSPNLARAIKQVNGIITDIGSPFGHMATIAREFRIPMIINTRIATKLLQHGQEITLDATENVVYAGYMRELCFYDFTETKFGETYEYRLLRRILKRISPLNLVDPKDKKFSPSYCKTFHDLIRYIHEQAVRELIDQNYFTHSFVRKRAVKVNLTIPLDLVVIDISNKSDFNLQEIEPEELVSLPLRKFLKGVSVPGIWAREPMPVDFKSFVSSMTKTFSSDVADPRFVGQNLAVISPEYANISLRLGYHFTMIDTFATSNARDNYIYFRFFGGVTDDTRKTRRARLIGKLLAESDFFVSIKGDLVIGRLKGVSKEEILEKMFVLGILVAYTRQLDVLMKDDHKIDYFLSEFHNILMSLN